MTVCNGVLPGAEICSLCSPSETRSTTLVAPTRVSSAKSWSAASKPSEIEVLPSADIWSIPALITVTLYDHATRIVAFPAKDTTAKRVAFSPREYWLTSCFAKAFSPPGPSIEPSGGGFFIEPLSSSTRAKSIGAAQGGSGSGGSDRTRPPADVPFFTSSSPEAAKLVDHLSSLTCDVIGKAREVLRGGWPARARVNARMCVHARAVVAVSARNIGIHCGRQAKPRTRSCALELRERNMPQLDPFARPGWV